MTKPRNKETQATPSQYEASSYYPRSSSRLRKWGERAVAAVAVVGLGAGVYALNKQSKEHDAQRVVEMNSKFEPVLRPAAEKVAKFVIAEAAQTHKKGHEGVATIHGDSGDPTKSILSYTKSVEGGEYAVYVVTGEDANGEPDATKVESAEISRTYPDEHDSNVMKTEDMIEIEKNDPNLNKGYWGANVTFKDLTGKGTNGLASYNTYNYESDPYDDLGQDVSTAEGVAKTTDEAMQDIKKGTPISHTA
jgi:hypothetical protein